MNKLKLTTLQQEILRFLFMHAGEVFNARGLALSLKVSQPAIAKALPLLKKQGLINVSKDIKSKRLSIELNRENPLVIGMKRADNIKQLYESGLADFLKEKFPSWTIIVFGSFARGEDTSKSDIDIAIIGAKIKAHIKKLSYRLGPYDLPTSRSSINLGEFERKLGKEIRPNFYQSLKEIDNDLKANIFGGILLSGWIEL